MGILTFSVILLPTQDDISLVLWQSERNTSLSPFGEQVRNKTIETIEKQLDMDAWRSYCNNAVPEGKVVQLGTVSVDDTKTIVNEGYFKNPTDDVSIQDHPLNF